MFKTFSSSGTLVRYNYYIHCSLRGRCYSFSAIHHNDTLSNLPEEDFSFDVYTNNLDAALEEYCKYLVTKVSEKRMHDFYFQGKIVLTIPTAG